MSIHFDGELRSSESAFSALPRWEIADFSSGNSSPHVLPSPSSGMKIGSYPKPLSPKISSEMIPGHFPSVIIVFSGSETTATALYSALLFSFFCNRSRIPLRPMVPSTKEEYGPGKPPRDSMNIPESSTKMADPS